jgi:hypothetical protein
VSVKSRRKHVAAESAPVPQPAGAAPGASVVPFLERHPRAIVLALILIATVRIVATYTVFNHTYDEPAHIACGMEWLDKGVYRWEPQHPPLARVMTALGPYLIGARSQNTPKTDEISMSREGIKILNSGQKYDQTLALARLGILPFFWIACVVVYQWGKRYFSSAVAVMAVSLFSFVPSILAHASLATTDMALTAFLGAAFLSGMIWLERPSVPTGLAFGAFTGLAVLSKFSTFVFFPAVVAAALAWYYAAERPKTASLGNAARARVPTFLLAVVTACLLIWAGYRFSFDRLPAPELFQGIQDVSKHNAEGHPGYLLGQYSRFGFWYFFPVVLAVKTPIPLLILLGAGVWLVLRKQSPYRHGWIPVAFAGGILLVAAFSKINIGVRHVLPVYMAFSLLAAAGAIHLLTTPTPRKWVPAALAALFLWFAGTSLLSHPDYIPYFNFLAGSRPEKIVVDSDLDWGQDVKRLAKRLHEVRAKEVTFANMMVGDTEKDFGFPHMVSQLDPTTPNPGWNAVSLSFLKARRLGLFEAYPNVELWPDRVPIQERVGKGILLWYFPPQ